MGRPRKVDRAELVRQWNDAWMTDKRPSKSDFARRFCCDRRTVLRILKEAVDNYELPLAAIGPSPFQTTVEQRKPQGLIYAW